MTTEAITSGSERIFNEKVWVPSHAPMHFAEQVDGEGEQKFILSGLMLPFGKISRNNVLYNKESIVEKHKQLLGRPVMFNHLVEGNNYPKGHFIESVILERPTPGYEFTVPGWYYKADIDSHEEQLIRKLKRGDLKNVSIQLLGGKIVERIGGDGKRFVEAYVQDIIEGSIVVAPGFLDTTAKFAESLGISEIEANVEKIMEKSKAMLVRAAELMEASDYSTDQLKGVCEKLKEEFGLDDSQAKEIMNSGLIAVNRMLGIDAEPEDVREFISNEDITTTTGSGVISPALLARRKKKEEEGITQESMLLAEKVITEIGGEVIKDMLAERSF